MDALNEYEWLKYHFLLTTIDRSAAWDDTLTIFILKVWSLAKHLNDIVDNYSYLKNDIIGFTETQMKPTGSASIRDELLKDLIGC